MVPLSSVAGVAMVALGMVITPGPNMVHLASRSISQGRRAGLLSLAGVAVGFVAYLSAAAAGLSALFRAVPATYATVRIAGACYLAYLAFQMLRPGGRSPFEARALRPQSSTRLFSLGLFTALLNPKIALMYAALIPQFIHAGRIPGWQQFLELGGTQIVVSILVNTAIVLVAARVASFLTTHPRVLLGQRVVAGSVLAGFAVKMAISRR